MLSHSYENDTLSAEADLAHARATIAELTAALRACLADTVWYSNQNTDGQLYAACLHRLHRARAALAKVENGK